MTIRFAGARATRKSAIRAWQCRSVPLCAANDNIREEAVSPTLAAALRHFARHGLAAAQHAGESAFMAWDERDSESCRHWLDVCRLLDRRMADRIDAHLSLCHR